MPSVWVESIDQWAAKNPLHTVLKKITAQQYNKRKIIRLLFLKIFIQYDA